MTAKEEVTTFLRNMPDDITFDEIRYEFFVLEKLKISEEASRNGQVCTHEEVKEHFKKWLLPDLSANPKARVIEMFYDSPNDLTYEDIRYRVSVLEKTARGIESADSEPTISQKEMGAEFSARFTE
jgi:hypothetical protein